MSNINYEYGPFGVYKRGSGGHVLNALTHYGINLSLVENIILDSRNNLSYHGKHFGRWCYIDGIEQPLFNFVDPVYTSLCIDGNYQLTLGAHNNPTLIITTNKGNDSVKMCSVINECFPSSPAEPFYNLKEEAGALFKNGSDKPADGRFYIEFWKPAGAQAFLNNFNELKNNLIT